jgi:hypothetical protein
MLTSSSLAALAQQMMTMRYHGGYCAGSVYNELLVCREAGYFLLYVTESGAPCIFKQYRYSLWAAYPFKDHFLLSSHKIC